MIGCHLPRSIIKSCAKKCHWLYTLPYQNIISQTSLIIKQIAYKWLQNFEEVLEPYVLLHLRYILWIWTMYVMYLNKTLYDIVIRTYACNGWAVNDTLQQEKTVPGKVEICLAVQRNNIIRMKAFTVQYSIYNTIDVFIKVTSHVQHTNVSKSATLMFVKQPVQSNIKDIKAPHYWPFVEDISWWAGDSPHKDPVVGKACTCQLCVPLLFLCWSTSVLFSSLHAMDQRIRYAIDCQRPRRQMGMYRWAWPEGLIT